MAWKIALGIFCTKISIFCLSIVFCAFLKADVYFENGPSFYDLLYLDPTTCKENQESFTRVQVLKNIAAWMQHYQSRGINLFNLPILDIQGVTIFDSEALKSVGFRYIQDVGDLLPLVIMEARKRNLKISIPLDELAHIATRTKKYKEWLNCNKLTKDCVANFIREIGIAFKAYNVKVWVNEQFFPPAYRQAIANACLQNDVLYIRYGIDKEGYGDIFYSEDYGTFPFSPESLKEDASYLFRLSQLGIAHFRIGYHNMIFGQAKALGKKAGVITTGGWGLAPGCQFNVALYRSIQFSPQYYSFFPAFYEKPPYENEEDVKFIQNFHYEQHLLSYIKKFSCPTIQNQTRLKANIVLDIPPDPLEEHIQEIWESSLSCSMEAVTNAITAAGMDLYVSIQKPMENADLYYIFTLGSCSEKNIFHDINLEISHLFPCEQRVFLQCVLGFPKGERWQKISSYFGIPAEAKLLMNSTREDTLVSPIPALVSYSFPSGEFPIKWRGYQFWIKNLKEAGNLATFHSINMLSQKECSQDIEYIASQQSKEFFFPLLTKKKNYFFINGNFLHLDVSNILCNLISSSLVFYRPAPIYLTTGENACAVFAVEDCTLEIALHQSQGSKIYHWNKNGKEYPSSPLFWEGKILKGKIQKWDLVVVENQPKLEKR